MGLEEVSERSMTRSEVSGRIPKKKKDTMGALTVPCLGHMLWRLQRLLVMLWNTRNL